MSGPYIQQLSGSYIQQLRDRIDFIEFKQNILFLKPPHLKASVFAQLSLDEFIKIRELTYMYSYRIENNERLTISDYEKELLKICSPLRSYPSYSTLIAKAIMNEDTFNKLFQYNN